MTYSEEYWREVFFALQLLNPDNEHSLNHVNGCILFDGYEVYPEQVQFHRDIEVLIDKRNYYLNMSAEAKMIINFLCRADWNLVVENCGSKRKKSVSATSVERFFRKKWGYRRVKKAIKEIRELLAI